MRWTASHKKTRRTNNKATALGQLNAEDIPVPPSRLTALGEFIDD